MMIDKTMEYLGGLSIPRDMLEFWSYMYFWAQDLNETQSPYTLLDTILDVHV